MNIYSVAQGSMIHSSVQKFTVLVNVGMLLQSYVPDIRCYANFANISITKWKQGWVCQNFVMIKQSSLYLIAVRLSETWQI